MSKVAGKILHNSYWYSLEMALETLVVLGTSVAVARYLGPTKLGYFTLVNFFVAVVQRTGGTGLSVTTRKYMSEFIAQERMGRARAVYELSYRYQLYSALFIAVLGVATALVFGDPHYRLMSCLLIVSIVPGLMSWVPAQANQAFEDVSNNTISALGYLVSYTVIIALTVHFQWDLVGVATATLISRTIEVVWRTIPLNRKMAALPKEAIDRELKRDVQRFCLQATGLQLVTGAAFDRTEILFLKAYSTLDQIAFYSVSVSLSLNLLVPPRVLGFATGASLMVEASRDARRVASIVRNACTYTLLAIFPITFGAAAVALSATQVVYGSRYIGAVPAMMISSILILPRAFQWVSDTLLRVADQQNRLIVWFAISAVFNALIDWFLIPRYGATGAAWGNGLGQTFAVIGTWMLGRKFFEYTFPWASALRIGASSVAMGLIAYGVSHSLAGPLGLAAGIIAGAAVYPVFLRMTGALSAVDAERLLPIGKKLPGSLRGAFAAVIRFTTCAPA